MIESGVRLRTFKIGGFGGTSTRDEPDSSDSQRVGELQIDEASSSLTEEALKEALLAAGHSKLRYLFRNIHTLEINVLLPFDFESDSQEEAFKSISSLIKRAPDLKHLTLKDLSLDYMSGEGSLSDLLDLDAACRLRSLNLEGVDVRTSHRDLRQFFTKHAPTLVQVTFVECKINVEKTEVSTWSRLLRSLRKINFGRLITFKLSFCEFDETDVFCAAYLRRETDDNPVAKYCDHYEG